ncbi:MAG TPA: sensor domain-containing diguanylate cyclase [Candidatus Eisenbacteria bacterium]|nr:sensor domain-containing diguanylate cyclase [Candidatus Eisenbacteria bacterium]
MKKAIQPPAGTTGTRTGALQRGIVLLWSVVALFVRIFGRRPKALPTPDAPAITADPELAVIAEKPKLTRHASRDKMYSPIIVDELIDKLRRQNGQIAFLSSVFKSTSDAVVVADLSGKITMFNKGAENIFELDETMALGDNLFRLCTDSTPDGPRIGRLLVENKRIENLRSELVGVAGKRTPVLLTVNFVEDDGGVPVAIVAVIKDNSQTESLLAEVTQKKEEVERLYVEVEKLSVTDEKTGLYNSRYFQRQIADEYERMKRGHMAELSLVVIDIDFFKKFNDTYGHQTGDDVLKAVAEVLKRVVRKIDVPCRFGGEEFMVILPSTGREGALRLAERIRTAVAELKVPVKGKSDVSVTISLGVRTHSPKDSTVGMFIHEADEAMYRAKQTGRNRTCTFESMAA